MRYPGFVEVWLTSTTGEKIEELFPGGELPALLQAPKRKRATLDNEDDDQLPQQQVITCYFEAKPGLRFKINIRDLKRRTKDAKDWLSYLNFLDGAKFEECKLETKKPGDKTITICAEKDANGQFREMVVKEVDVEAEPNKKLVDAEEFLSGFDSGIIAIQTTNEFIPQDEESEGEEGETALDSGIEGNENEPLSEIPFLSEPPPKVVPEELLSIVKSRRLAAGLGDVWTPHKDAVEDADSHDEDDDEKAVTARLNNTYWDKWVMFIFIALPAQELARRNIRAVKATNTKAKRAAAVVVDAASSPAYKREQADRIKLEDEAPTTTHLDAGFERKRKQLINRKKVLEHELREIDKMLVD